MARQPPPVFTLSDKFYRRVIELWIENGKSHDFPHPYLLRHSPEFALIERLIKIISKVFADRNEFFQNKAFVELYSCCFTGKNPFKDHHAISAGVDWQEWCYLIKSASNGFKEYSTLRKHIREMIRDWDLVTKDGEADLHAAVEEWKLENRANV